MDIQVESGAFPNDHDSLLRQAIEVTLSDDGRPSEVSLTLMDDDAITGLNRDYLGKDRPTDVIAFSLGTEDAPLGDVYIGYEQAVRQATELGVVLKEELVRLAVHGTLHVLGHDHPDGEERLKSPMFVVQERLVRTVLHPTA